MRLSTIATTAALLSLIGGGVAQAQTSRPERPYRGLFGSGSSDDVQQSVRVSGSVGGGYDTDRASDLRSGTFNDLPGGNPYRPGSLGAGALGQFSGALSYLFASDLANVSAAASTSGRYYPNGAKDIIRRDSVNVNGSTRVRGGFSLSGGAAYHPFTVSSLYSGLITADPNVPDTDFDLVALPEHVVSYNGGVTWSGQLSRRLGLNARYRYNGRMVSGDIPRYRSYESGGGLRYNLGRGLDLKLGYRYRNAQYATRDDYQNHLIDAGIDYQRALSFSRRTTLSFSTGTAAADDPTSGNGVTYRLIGDASLNHEIGRTWNAGASYRRNINLDEGFGEPVFTDSAAAQLGGLINRRVGVSTSVGMSRGRQLSNDRKGYNAYFGSAGLHFALGRYASFGASYQYQYRDYLNGYASIAGINPLVRRHSVHASVSLGVPLYQKTRRR